MKYNDKIRLNSMLFYAHHGAFAEERALGQVFEVDVEVCGEFSHDQGSDDLHWTVDYTLFYRAVTEIFNRENFHLLETCAGVLASELLKRFEMVQEVTVRVRKPHVPMGGVLKSVEVEEPAVAELADHAYVGFGSNLGDGETNFAEAMRRLAEHGLTITRLSSLYESEPWGGAEGDTYTNAVLELEKKNSAVECLQTLLLVELEMGRTRDCAMSARACDLDLLLWGNDIVSEPDLIVPHPRLHMRNFVLIPLCDLIPDAVHPAFNRSFSGLLAECSDPLHVWTVKPKHIQPLT